ncbi:hypothetical protein BP6252_01781 [Coleophoma cylindrospora]|uniref:WSC domain-containing protein n=1 Tax=Coleophoma cylindrospora TaxID=1849047 RepID=A0A3D8STW8_9HELO|nr:hypothetical protein BP6252_01781 [Coleophoma cylindrospora]
MAIYLQLLLLAFSWLAAGQQYQGNTITNSLPSVPGSELAYWKITDKKNRNFTLINYFSNDGNGNRLTTSNVKRAVVVLHGLGRDPGTYMSNMLSALSQVPSGTGPTFKNTQIIAPYFPNGDDKNYGYPWNTSAPAGGYGSYSDALVWQGSGWASGENNQYPRLQIATSSYDVLDQIIKYFGNSTRYPNLNQVVVAGHSLGAQMTQRYAAVGNSLASSLPSKLRVTYWVGNPNSFVWLNSSRPIDTSSCSTYDDWRDGLSNYDPTYGATLVAKGDAAVLANYNSRSIAYARGLQDLGDDSSGCEPGTTGVNRNERFFNFINWFPPQCASASDAACDTIDYINTGHDAGAMFASQAGLARLFIDNLNGDYSRATDFYCPRQAVGDNPLPNATCTSIVPQPSGTYSGMTYAGCYTDQTPQSFKYMAYDNSSNSVEFCTYTCAKLGYSVAGMEYSSQCFCGNGLTAKASKIANQGCYSACAGNSSEVCGGSFRLSVWSNGTPTILAEPSAPATINDYAHQGCYLDNNPSRALTGTGYTSPSSMTLESCAAFCASYKYFGVEYSQECYCGNSIASGDTNTTATDCSMTCTGNSLQLCGAGNRLSLYARNETAVVASSSTSTVTSSPAGVSTTSAVTSTSVSCPASNGTTYTVAATGNQYLIECGIDHAGGDMSSPNPQNAPDFASCIAICDARSGCVDVSLSGTACYLKSSVGAAVSGNVYGAKLIVAASTASTSTSISTSSTGSSSSTAGPTSVSTTISASSSTSSSTTATSAAATPSAVSCPASNNTVYEATSGSQYIIECGIDHAGGDMSAPNPQNAVDLAACIAICDARSGCVDVSLSGTACYLKSVVGAAVSNNVYGARLVIAAAIIPTTTSVPATSTGSSSSTALTTSESTTISSSSISLPTSTSTIVSSSPSTTLSTTSTSAAATPSAVSCPASNNTVFIATSGNQYLIECGVDHSGGDMSSPNGQYASGLSSCIAQCDARAGCVDVSLSGSACYLKSSVGAAISNGVFGARLLSGASSSATSLTSSTASSITTSSSISTSLSVSTSSVPLTSSSESASSSSAIPTTLISSSSTPSITSSSSTDSSSSISSSLTSSTSVPTTLISTSTSTSTSASASATLISCPASNNTIYTAPATGNQYYIECGIDHAGGDMSSPNGQYAASLAACILQCDARSGCVDVSLSGSACYLKSTLGAAIKDGVLGARLVTSSTTSTAAQSTATTTV